ARGGPRPPPGGPRSARIRRGGRGRPGALRGGAPPPGPGRRRGGRGGAPAPRRADRPADGGSPQSPLRKVPPHRLSQGPGADRGARGSAGRFWDGGGGRVGRWRAVAQKGGGRSAWLTRASSTSTRSGR